MFKCENCSHKIAYSKKNIDYNISCDKCKNKYVDYKPKFKEEHIEIFNNQTNNYITEYHPNIDGLDGCENWGIDG